MTSPVSIPLWCDCDKERRRDDFQGVSFQSHYGAIATVHAWVLKCAEGQFQSHYGAIATIGFSSLRRSSWMRAFQSHYGAIATPQAWCGCDVKDRFNPTMVRLRLRQKPALLLKAECFNPTMVRLRPRLPRPRLPGRSCFNPTMVRLRLGHVAARPHYFVRFNPTMVRLRPRGY